MTKTIQSLLTIVFGLAAMCALAQESSSSSASYIDNPNMYLDEVHAQAGQGPTKEGKLESKPSPTGSGVWYVRDQVEPVTLPSYKGKTYEVEIPATLDLAERARLALNAITRCCDVDYDYEIYGWKGNPVSRKAVMIHTYNDYNGGQAKWIQNLPLARQMSGSDMNIEVDRMMMETLFRMIAEDGLYYIPVKGAPWHDAFDSGWILKQNPNAEQEFDSWPNGRALMAMVGWFERNPQDESLKANIERMIDGFLNLATKQDKAAWLPAHFRDGKYPKDVPCPVKGVLSQGTLLQGVAHYYGLTKYPPAGKLGAMLVNYWLGPAQVFKENGDWDYGQATHFHGTTFAILGLLEWALATNDQVLLKKVAGAYEFGRGGCEMNLGWVPESYPALHANTEPCGIGDMTQLAARLSAAGAGDYWEDVERMTRNLLTQSQATDTWFVQRIADQTPDDTPVTLPLYTDKDVCDRMIGTWNGMTSSDGHFQPVSSHCCTGNAMRGMYHAWKNILTADGETLRINLLLNRASKWADVDSFLPYQGRVDVKMKETMSLMVRIPSWVEDLNTIQVTVGGKDVKGVMKGRYLDLGKIRKGKTAAVRFPLTDTTVKTEIPWVNLEKNESHKEFFTLHMRGFDVVDIWRRRQQVIYPFFNNESYRKSDVLWRKVARFAPEDERGW